MRKINKSEWKKTSKIFAKIFNEYDLYDLIFKRDKNFENKISYLFAIEVCGGINYTYEFDDFKGLATIKKPGDIDSNEYSCFFNPLFTFGFIINIRIKSSKIALEYLDYAKNVSSKFYNPDTDCYIKNIGVRKDCRGQGYLRKMISEICGDMPIYLETHDVNNVEIYKKLGFELLDVSYFRGKAHYAMKKY